MKTVLSLLLTLSALQSYSQADTSLERIIKQGVRIDQLIALKSDSDFGFTDEKKINQELAYLGFLLPAKMVIVEDGEFKWLTFTLIETIPHERAAWYIDQVAKELPFVKALDYNECTSHVTALVAKTLPNFQIDRLLKKFSYDGFVPVKQEYAMNN